MHWRNVRRRELKVGVVSNDYAIIGGRDAARILDNGRKQEGLVKIKNL